MKLLWRNNIRDLKSTKKMRLFGSLSNIFDAPIRSAQQLQKNVNSGITSLYNDAVKPVISAPGQMLTNANKFSGGLQDAVVKLGDGLAGQVPKTMNTLSFMPFILIGGAIAAVYIISKNAGGLSQLVDSGTGGAANIIRTVRPI